MYTVHLIYFKNVQYYCTKFNIVQKLKGTNKVGGQNKIRTAV